MCKNYVIKIEDLTKKFGKFIAVNNVNLIVEEGSIYGFLGHNGAGKSTLIKMMCGVLHASSGQITVAGINVAKNPEKVRRNLGYMSQKFTLYDDLTVMENLKFYANIYSLRGQVARNRIEEVKNMTGLLGKDTNIVKTLSGGWKQRLALCCALLHKPQLLILDEPTAGVDPISRRIFWEIIKELTKSGLTIFVTTHYMDEAELCDNVGIIYEGKIIAEGTPKELIKRCGGKTLSDVFIKYTSPQEETK